VNSGVGVLDEPRQQAGQHAARRRFCEFFGEDLYRGGRGNFAQIIAAHPVGNGEQIAVRAGLLARRGDERSHRVFIVGANFAEIAGLAELNIQHGLRYLENLLNWSADDTSETVKHSASNCHWVVLRASTP
jgi:hypothetical protein